MLVTTSADGSAAVWDLALERDPEEEAAAAAAMNAAAPDDLPPQLLFVHGGQGDLKEAHWHPQARPVAMPHFVLVPIFGQPPRRHTGTRRRAQRPRQYPYCLVYRRPQGGAVAYSHD